MIKFRIYFLLLVMLIIGCKQQQIVEETTIITEEKQEQGYFILKIAKCPSYNNSEFLFFGINDNLEDFWNGEDNLTRYFYRPIACFNYDGDCKDTYADSAVVWKNCSITYLNTSIFNEVLLFNEIKISRGKLWH